MSRLFPVRYFHFHFMFPYSLILVICFDIVGIMTLQQTIKIPADRRVHFDLPRDIPAGVAKFKLIITPFRAPRTDAAPQAAEIALAESEVAAAEAEAAEYTDAGKRIPIPLRGKVSMARLKRNKLILPPGSEPLLAWSGVGEGLESEEEKLEWKREDKRIEEEHEKWLYGTK
jgi:hypothetical protein